MTIRRAVFAALVVHSLIACGGRAEQLEADHSGGAGGMTTIAATLGGHGGNPSGGRANGGASGQGASGQGASSTGGADGANPSGGCCAASPICGEGERQVPGPEECPQQSTCYTLSICCSTIWCTTALADVGGSGGSGGAAGDSDGGAAGVAGLRECGDSLCTATQACLAYRAAGGGRLTPDAGTCPPAQHVEGGVCESDFAYACAELHGACQNQPVTCGCAEPQNDSPGICPTGFGACSAPGANVDPSAQLICEEDLP